MPFHLPFADARDLRGAPAIRDDADRVHAEKQHEAGDESGHGKFGAGYIARWREAPSRRSFAPHLTANTNAMTAEPPHSRYGSGKSVRRVEDDSLLTGRDQFADNFSLPGQAYLAFVRSPHPHARITAIDAAAAADAGRRRDRDRRRSRRAPA